MFSSLPGPGFFLFVAALLCAVVFTLTFIVLKLCGVLLLPWWLVAVPVPALLVAMLLGAGLHAIFFR